MITLGQNYLAETYAISGLHGFIAQHIKKILRERGDFVIGIPRDMLYNPIELEGFFRKWQPSVIIHTAAYGNHYQDDNPSRAIFSNISATMNMLQASLNIQYKGFINFSSSSVLLPKQTFYSASKACSELIANVFIQQYNKPILTVRPYSIYGEGEADFRFIPTVVKALLSGETIPLNTQAMHDWVYVDDFCDVLLDNIGMQNIDQTLNLGTGYSYSNLDIVKKLETISGKKLKYVEKSLRSYDTQDWVCPEQSVSSNLDAGLLKTFNYYAKKFT